MNHTKPNFRAWREIVGLSQADMAGLMGVSTTAVKRWEHPDGPQPPEDAWDELEILIEKHQKSVDAAVGIVLEKAAKIGEGPKMVTLPYWRSQDEYDEHVCDSGSFSVANARERAIALQLIGQGFNIDFISREDRVMENEVTMASNLTYDLSPMDAPIDERRGIVELLAWDEQGRGVCIWTNRYLCGLFRPIKTPSGIEYSQIAGDMQASYGDKRHVKRSLHDKYLYLLETDGPWDFRVKDGRIEWPDPWS